MPVGTAERLEMRWVPVTMPDGRTQMESIWVTPSRPAAIATVETSAPSTTLATSAAQHAA